MTAGTATGSSQAARTLRSGGLAIVPTETVWGLAGRLDAPAAVEALRQLAGIQDGGPLVWHAPSMEAAVQAADAAGQLAESHRRLLTALLPGPVRFEIEASGQALHAMLGAAGLPAGVADDGESLHLRVPAHAATRQLLEDAGGAVGMISWADAGGRGRRPPPADIQTGHGTNPTTPPADEPLPVALLEDPGTQPAGKPSTAVRLRAGGAFDIVSIGAATEDTVMAALRRKILFVCTGNTCRSPMAEAIARGVLAGTETPGLESEVCSAGVTAAAGMPASPQAAEAMRQRGLSIDTHRSTPLTADLVRSADLVLAMTPAHAEAARRLAPERRARVVLLDPDGVPDPFGGSLDDYLETAERLASALKTHLSSPASPGRGGHLP